MAKGFPGFPPEAVKFFSGLARNNRRDWFQARKTLFEGQVKRPMLELVASLNREFAGFAPSFVTDPAKAVYRIYRDTRFSNNKKPYKEHLAASFHHGPGAAHAEAGYYFAISHKEVAIGGGLYMPDPKTLLGLRTLIAENHKDLRKILANRRLRTLLGDLQGEQLSRVPKGFQTDHPAADLLRFKQFVLYIVLPPELATTPALEPEILKRFRAMTPFLNFLTAPLENISPTIGARDLL
jgi:uncharacterized protein (TIGR02453 family)